WQAGDFTFTMHSLCNCGRYVIPVSTLLSRKFNRSASCTHRYFRLTRSDQVLGQVCKRHFRTVCTATVEQERDFSRAVPTAVQQKPAFRAYLDFKALKADLDEHVQNCKNRKSNADPTKVASLYDQYCEATQRVDRTREDRNSNAKAMKGKMDPERRQSLIQQGKSLKESLAQLEDELESLQDSLQREGQLVPNLAHPSVPVGGEEAAIEVASVGEQRTFDFDISSLLELALVNYAMQKVVSKGFIPMMTPDLVRESVLEKCGFQPRGTETQQVVYWYLQVYSVQDSPLCLTGTAEVPLGAIYMDQILAEEQLPIKMAGFGHCFRTEAGAGGSASRGLYRVHQFSKVEMFVVCTPEQSEALLEEVADLEKEMFTELGLHFKILDMPSGDLGAPAYRKYDIEAWMPGAQRYGEISSASNCTDYQSRRLNIRYRPKATDAADAAPSNGSKQKAKKVPTEFVHTLNATACAVPRMIVAILENFQQADGSVVIPEALRPYMGNMSVITAP
ncbi:MAG: seryl-tRNA synthetase, partial [Trebouxia sp. A1-2]